MHKLGVIILFVFLAKNLYSEVWEELDESLLNEYLDKKCKTLQVRDGRFVKEDYILNNYWNFDSTGRPKNQTYVFSKKGNFCIHYDTLNLGDMLRNAVPMEDIDGNGIPDYVDSVAYYFEYVLSFYTDTIGFKSPIIDESEGGKGYFDVYLINIGEGPDAFYGLTYNDKIIYADPPFYRYSSWIMIDNDYSPTDSTVLSNGAKIPTYRSTGIDGMKVTVAHELHHAVQFVYGITEPPVPSLMEMSSTYMEYRVFPTVNDYYQYVVSLFKNFGNYPFGSANPEVGYRWGIFGQYLHSKYGDFAIRRMWELIGSKVNPYKALDSAIVERNSNLSRDWCDFLKWLYFTGTRTVQKKYFRDGDKFPTLNPDETLHYSKPFIIHSNTLKSYQVKPVRFILAGNSNIKMEDTVDVIFSNNDTPSAIFQTQLSKGYSFLITDQNQPNTLQIDKISYYYNFDAPNGDVCFDLFLNSGVEMFNRETCYPNPFKPALHRTLNIPAPENSLLGNKVHLAILTSDLTEVYSTTASVGLDKFNKVIKVENLPADLTSGLYIYRIVFNGQESYGKFYLLK